MADSYSVQSREGATKREVPLTPEEKQAWSAKLAKQREEDAIIAEHKAKEDSAQRKIQTLVQSQRTKKSAAASWWSGLRRDWDT